MRPTSDTRNVLAPPNPGEEATSGCQRTVSPTTADVIGKTYKILRRVGRGGMSDVFAVEHLRLGRVFALKMLRAEVDAERATERFRREAKAIASLNSEFVVQVVDCGEHDDRTPYLVMELLEGQDLRSLLKRHGTLPPTRVVPLILEACRGLARVHAAGLVHRDLKPENVFVARRESGEDWCKILDFGVAKMASGLATTEGTVVGTARYMAPEQLADGDKVDPTTDIYALGAIMYECLSGRSLHQGATMQEVMFRVMNEAPVPLSSLCPQLPRDLCELVAKATAKQQSARPQSAEELAELLSVACVASSAEDATVFEVRRRTLAPGIPKPRPRPLAVALIASCAFLAAAWVHGRLTKPIAVALAGATSPSVAVPVPHQPEAARSAPMAEPTLPLNVVITDAPLHTRKNVAPSATVLPKTRITAAAPAKLVGSVVHLPAEGRFDELDPYAK
jgi:eukaryotic-like serine/threonine-protein kinase